MRDKSPCVYPVICQKRYPGCQSKCPIGKPYFEKLKAENDRIRAERNRQRDFDDYKGERVYATKKRYGLE